MLKGWSIGCEFVIARLRGILVELVAAERVVGFGL
tara:strand:- start:1554 stop:1658 length:105 start_codon:yes stop_codon:yes gene_type:complete